MLSDLEAKEAYNEILEILSRSNLSWIVLQVQEEVSRGKVITKSLKDISINDTNQRLLENEFKVAKSMEKLSISETYSGKEQLSILLNAVEAISIAQQIKGQALANLQKFDQKLI